MSMIVGRFCGFGDNIEIIKSLNCLEYVGVIEGKEPFKIFIAKAL